MRKTAVKKNFDFYIDEYLYYCQSRRLRQRTLNSYEQTLRLFERWLREQEGIETPQLVREQTIRHYICDLQERGKYSFYCNEERTVVNCPERRRDYRQPVSVTTVNNYIRNLKAFFNWYSEEIGQDSPMRKVKQLKNRILACSNNNHSDCNR